MQCKAEQLNNPKDIFIGIKAMYTRSNKKVRDVGEFLKMFPRRVYKFIPKAVWVNGDSKIEGNFIDIRTEISLDKLKAHINEQNNHS